MKKINEAIIKINIINFKIFGSLENQKGINPTNPPTPYLMSLAKTAPRKIRINPKKTISNPIEMRLLKFIDFNYD